MVTTFFLMIFIMYLLAPSLQEERKRSRPSPNCDGALDVRSFELVGERPLERPQNYLYRMNTHVHTTLIWMIPSLKIFWLREIGSPDISTPKIFVKIHRRQRLQNNLRTTSESSKKSIPVICGPLSSILHEHVFLPVLSIVATMRAMSRSSSSLISPDSDWPYNERQVHD